MAIETKKVYKATSAVHENYQIAIKAREHQVMADEPAPIGDNVGMTPMELLLGAMGGCKSIVFKSAAKKLKIAYTKCEIEVEGDFDSAGYMGDPNIPIGFSAIRTIYHINSIAAKEEIEQLIAFVESHCPVAATIEVSPKMDSVLKYNA
ncbi:OsmC family protein [Ignatzschineria rhizosphaerae]|uniref:OsmC family protein n=1 Tax=Ignatzschineria rhizosphaerae TaxID=2923279 RepID=A0ABY3WYT0_9GAMM|nr:OsmC family protein [Ignatzschineria rhizosphaerae]UNM95771.1 OsmC family protein [Ignatzschineria rhizosphaerae]